jgi:hypothetical protein
MGVLGLYLDEWHTGEYAKTRSLKLSGKDIDKNLTYVILFFIGLSIFLELVKAFVEMFSKKKYRKYYPIDDYLEE